MQLHFYVYRFTVTHALQGKTFLKTSNNSFIDHMFCLIPLKVCRNQHAQTQRNAKGEIIGANCRTLLKIHTFVACSV